MIGCGSAVFDRDFACTWVGLDPLVCSEIDHDMASVLRDREVSRHHSGRVHRADGAFVLKPDRVVAISLSESPCASIEPPVRSEFADAAAVQGGEPLVKHGVPQCLARQPGAVDASRVFPAPEIHGAFECGQALQVIGPEAIPIERMSRKHPWQADECGKHEGSQPKQGPFPKQTGKSGDESRPCRKPCQAERPA